LKIKNLILIGLIGTKILYSQGFRNPPEGSAALSQAGAFIAQCDDASAITHNPAGLIQIKGQQILFGTNLIFPYTDYNGGSFSDERKFKLGALPYFYYVSDFNRDNIRFGIGITSPYGQSTKWSYDAVKNWGYSVPYLALMQTADVCLVSAFRVNERISTGIGINFYKSRIVVNNLLPPETPAKMRVDGEGYAPSFGFLYKKEKFRIGLNWRGGFKIKYSGKFKIPGSVQTGAKTEIKFPHIIGGGVAIFPNKKWKLEGDIEWVGYSCLERIPVDIKVVPPYQLDKKWEDVFNFYLGSEYKKNENLKLRCGIAYVRTPIPDETWEPSLPGANRIVLSAGSELKTKIGKIEFAFAYSIFHKRTIKQGGSYDGTYKSKGFFFTMGYKNEI